MPTETRGIYFGGGGSGAFGYISPAKRRTSQDDSLTKRITRYTRIIRQVYKEDEEIFVFTLKEPIKTIINRLMDLFRQINEENPEEETENFNLSIVSGPLGYTKLHAFRPIIPTVTQIVFKPVMK